MYKLLQHPTEKGEYISVKGEEISKGTIIYDIVNRSIFKALIDYRKIEYPQYFKIYTSTIFIHPSIPLMKKEQILFDNNVESIANSVYKTSSESTKLLLQAKFKESWIEGFESGYNKRAETHLYAEFDMEAAVCFGMTLERFKDDEFKLSDNEEFKGFLQSLKQPKERLIEFEMEGYYPVADDFYSSMPEYDGTHPVSRIKLYQEGEHSYVNIKSIKPI